MASKRLPINGLEQQIYSWGNSQNPTVILLHGWLDSGGSFAFLADELQNDYYLVAPDMRGYGLSAHSQSPLGYFFFEYVADLHALVELFSPGRPVILLGHSLGGGIASVYGGAFPERIRRLINVEGFGFQRPGGRGPVQRARDWIRGMPPQPFPVHPSLEGFADRLRKFNPRLSAHRASVLARCLAHEVPGGFQMAADPKHLLVEPYHFPQDILAAFWKAVTVPSLFIYGEDSQLTKWFSLSEVTGNFPGKCRVESVPDCSHAVHHDQPEYLAKRIRDFLSS